MARTATTPTPASIEQVSAMLERTPRLRDRNGHEAVLSPQVVEAFQAALAELDRDNNGGELTTQQAARLLGVSRPTLIRLLDTGALRYRRTHGTSGHRRVARRDALTYLRTDLERRRRILDDLAQDAEELGFFDT